MRRYHVPLDLRQEEKVIGGYLSARQAGYLLAGFLLGVLLARLSSAGLFLLPVAAAAFMSFGRVHGENADRYLLLLADRRPKEYPYRRRA